MVVRFFFFISLILLSVSASKRSVIAFASLWIQACRYVCISCCVCVCFPLRLHCAVCEEEVWTACAAYQISCGPKVCLTQPLSKPSSLPQHTPNMKSMSDRGNFKPIRCTFPQHYLSSSSRVGKHAPTKSSALSPNIIQSWSASFNTYVLLHIMTLVVKRGFTLLWDTFLEWRGQDKINK